MAKFEITSLEILKAKCKELGVDIPIEESPEKAKKILSEPMTIGRHHIPNRCLIHPMEGFDSEPDGSPSELSYRRYRRWAQGRAGIIWFEATSVVPEGRSNPHQFWIHENNIDKFANLVDTTKRLAKEKYGQEHQPICVLQLTHSGRYSNPNGNRAPIIAYHDKFLDPSIGISDDYPIVDDDYLENLEDKFAQAAVFATQAGFDAIDIKSCHRYLINELLAARLRKGRYGGSFENRTRFLLNVIDKINDIIKEKQIHDNAPDIYIRLGCFDGMPSPFGWASNEGEPVEPKLDELFQLLELLKKRNVALISVTAGNPYYSPHINRPYSKGLKEMQPANEHPLIGVARLLNLSYQVKHAIAEGEDESENETTSIVSAGYSWLREYAGYAMAGTISQGWADLVGAGRLSFAYPDWPKDLLENGNLDKRKVCLACSLCTALMRKGGPTGCAIRDKEIYRFSQNDS